MVLQPCGKFAGHSCVDLFLDSQSVLFPGVYAVFMPVPHYFDYHIFVINSGIGKGKFSTLFFCEDYFGFSGPFATAYEFGISFAFFAKKRWNFDKNCIASGDHLEEYCHLNSNKSSSPWTQDVFPFISVSNFFGMFHIVVFSV